MYPRIRAFANVAGKAYNAYNSYTKTKSQSNRNGSTGATLTAQHDVKQQYRFKPMPKRKKRVWKKFVRKVKAVEASGRGTQQAIINDGFNTSWASTENPTIPRQGVSEVNLYSVNGIHNNGEIGNRDKDVIMNEVRNYKTTMLSGGSETIVVPSNEATRSKVTMTGAHMDITYTNLSDRVIEVDLYTVVHRKIGLEVTNGLATGAGYPTNLNNAQNLYNSNDAPDILQYKTVGLNTVSGYGVQPDLTCRGVTPFQTWGVMKYAGAKILTKTKVLIGSGQSITRKYALNQHKTLYSHNTTTWTRYDKDTVTYLAIAKATGNSTDESTHTLRTSFTKVYTWTVEGQATARCSYFGPGQVPTDA